MSCLGAFNEYPHAAGSETGDPADDAWRRFLFDAQARARILVEVNAAQLGGSLASISDGEAINAQAFNEAPGAPVAFGQRSFMFGDGVWFGRPSDALKPNKMADARIVASADIDRSIALAPEATRRGEIIVGEIRLANGDGGLDEIVSRYTISGRRVSIRLGPARGDFTSFALIQDTFAQGWEVSHDSVRLRLQSTAAFLSTPLQPRKYNGTGGVEGDAALMGRGVPSLWGECSNVTPVLINRDQWVYQVHDGPIYAVDAVMERGLPFVSEGDVPTYAELRALTVSGGAYATCLSAGMVKIGLGVAGPAGPITMDVRGDAASGGYADTTGEILLRMALTRARIDGGLVDRNSFVALPKGRVGYYDDGTTDTTVAMAFDALLRGTMAYYGTNRSAALTANAPRAPTEARAYRMAFDRLSIIDIEDIGTELPPRWAQSATYARNWTPIPEDQLSDALSSEERARLSRPFLTVRRVAGEVQQRDRGAIEGAVIDTYFAESDAADDVCQQAMDLFKETRRRFRVSVPRIGYIVDLGQTVRISYPRFDMAAGKNMLVTGIRDNGSRGVIELTVWA